MMKPLYTYAAVVVRWVDGDTVDLVVDLGFRMQTKDRFRLSGIDTPERGQPNYHEATTFMETLASPGTPVTIKTFGETEKYGRWLADIYAGDLNLNEAILRTGLAKPYDGGAR
jgi:micrococcal nuclease